MRSAFLFPFALVLLAGPPALAAKKVSAHYEVFSDDQQLANNVSGIMEKLYVAYGKLLHFYPEPKRARFWVKVFSTKAGTNRYCRKLHGGPTEVFRYYHSGPGKLTNELVGWRVHDVPLQRRLGHEGFHQYFRAIIDQPPQWVNEGMAEVCESAKLTERGFELRPHRGWSRDWREGFLKLDKGTLTGRRKLIPVRKLILMTKAAWMADIKNAYPMSWAVVNDLLTTRNPGERKALTEYLRALQPRLSRPRNNARGFAAPAFKKLDLKRYESNFLYRMRRFDTPGGRTFRRAMKAMDRKRYKDAIRDLDSAIQQDPDNDRFYWARGVCRYSLSRLKAAETDLKRAVALSPEYIAAHFQLGKVYVFMKKGSQARRAFALAGPKYAKAAKSYLARLKR